MGPPKAPPNPANAAPKQNTVVNKRDAGIPTARAIGISSTPARIMAPSRVLSISKYSNMPTTMEKPKTTNRYVGKRKPKNSMGARNMAGV